MPDESPPTVTSDAALRALYDAPGERSVKKQLDRLDGYCKRFIALSPFVCLATADADGRIDVSPRGDAPGFVAVLDDRTLLIPDRRGNNRLDSLANIVANPQVGLLFMVPGIDETVRVNGRAGIVREPELLARFAVRGTAPTVAIRVHVEEAFFHCAKAFIRARLWAPEARVDRKVLPRLGRIIAEQIAGQAIGDDEAAAADAWVDDGYRTRLY
jgi:PPOX class probable FMN-dependent enzyme